jgi:hypothetical protein
MSLFMDYHQDLKLPAETIAQIAEDTLAGPARRPVRPAAGAAGPANRAPGPA